MKIRVLLPALLVVCSLSSNVFAGGLLDSLLGHKKGSSCCAPEPTCCAPEPVCCEPEPVCCEPEPVCCAPEPVCCEPEPVCCEPAPCCAPEPVCCEPEPVCCEPTGCGCAAPKKEGLLARLFGHKKKSSSCCEPVCCEPEPVCCEPEPVCCEPAPCCEPAGCGCGSAKKEGLLSRLFGHKKKSSSCGCSTGCGCATSYAAPTYAPMGDMPPAPMVPADHSAGVYRGGASVVGYSR